MRTHGKNIRVAAAQFYVGCDLDENLANCLSLLDKAAGLLPDIVVLPEFINHLSWYNDKQHCLEVSVSPNSDFLKAIARKANTIGSFVVVNCSVRRSDDTVTGSSLLYSPEGELVLDNTKQIYIGHENNYFKRADTAGRVINTRVGRLGLYACMDGIMNETPRCLALSNAQILLNSLNSFAYDEASLHVPVRAAENKVFVVAANKVGCLVPEHTAHRISTATGIPLSFLNGAGESQIVSPQGVVLAKASRDDEQVIYADIDPSLADNKQRPDGTDIFRYRRPELYKAISQNPARQSLPAMTGSDALPAALVQLENQYNLQEAAYYTAQAFAQNACLVALPPLFNSTNHPQQLADQSIQIITTLQSVCANGGSEHNYIATAAVLGSGSDYQYCAVLIGADGVVLRQAQIHYSKRNVWSRLTQGFNTVQLPFARVGLVTSDDSIYPETFRLLALSGVEVAIVLLLPLEPWELQTGLLERAAENRINVLAAAHPSSLGNSFSAALQTDFTHMSEWHEREFDGLLSQPILQRAPALAGVFPVTLYPANATNKVVSTNTDLLANRPWDLADAITQYGELISSSGRH